MNFFRQMYNPSATPMLHQTKKLRFVKYRKSPRADSLTKIILSENAGWIFRVMNPAPFKSTYDENQRNSRFFCCLRFC